MLAIPTLKFSYGNLLLARLRELGSANIEELRTESRFIKISAAALRESHVHDVIVTKEAPNYQMED